MQPEHENQTSAQPEDTLLTLPFDELIAKVKETGLTSDEVRLLIVKREDFAQYAQASYDQALADGDVVGLWPDGTPWLTKDDVAPEDRALLKGYDLYEYHSDGSLNVELTVAKHDEFYERGKARRDSKAGRPHECTMKEIFGEDPETGLMRVVALEPCHPVKQHNEPFFQGNHEQRRAMRGWAKKYERRNARNASRLRIERDRTMPTNSKIERTIRKVLREMPFDRTLELAA